MPDEPTDRNVRPFQPKAVREQAREMLGRLQLDAPPTPLRAVQKLGLYPLAEDVIISRPLYALIVLKLRSGTDEERKRVADLMDSMLDAPFAP